MRIISTKLLFVSLIFLSSFVVNACDTCTVRNATVHYAKVSYEGVLYDFPAVGQSTWFYKINNTDNRGSDISHFNFGVGLCLTPNMLVGGGTYTSKTLPGLNYTQSFSLGKDGTDNPSKMYGIKYDTEILKGTTRQIFFVLNTKLMATANVFKIKSSNLFYQGIICLPSINCEPLPVELINFGASYSNGYPLLRWATATEMNNEGFEIEHSVDALTFSKIGFVESHHFSNSIQQYKFVDYLHQEGYYRLKVIDYDSHFDYSDIVVINKKMDVTLSPNPVISEFYVTLGSNHITEIKIISPIGFDITESVSIQKFETHWIVDVSNLPKGFYSLIINNHMHGCFIHL